MFSRKNKMSLKKFNQIFLPAIEAELQQAVAGIDGPGLQELHTMMVYHMGWEPEDANPQTTGKRIRPVIVLLTAQAAGGLWEDALPAAAAVELIHNFSLLHDDIEDNSPLRRGRPTVWTKWGIPQAINAGDAMFTLAHLALIRLQETVSPAIAFKANQVLQQTCLHLTQGQYLDISYEKRKILSLQDYWPMVTGKTAALIAACTELGALIADTDEDTRTHYRRFGLNLGLAFQVLDDVLGIWGDSTKIGKSNTSDLVEGKKSLPVLYGMEKNGKFAERWIRGSITSDEVPGLAKQLEIEGGRDYAQNQADLLTQQALQSLEDANPQGEAGDALFELANFLLKRQI
jgi:geranylgeranyl diphosphate synthase type I